MAGGVKIYDVYSMKAYQCRDWAFYVTSVIIMGDAKLITDETVICDKVRKLGLKYFPTKEEVDAEISRDIKRVQLVEISIEHMTGKLVHEK